MLLNVVADSSGLLVIARFTLLPQFRFPRFGFPVITFFTTRRFTAQFAVGSPVPDVARCDAVGSSSIQLLRWLLRTALRWVVAARFHVYRGCPLVTLRCCVCVYCTRFIARVVRVCYFLYIYGCCIWLHVARTLHLHFVRAARS